MKKIFNSYKRPIILLLSIIIGTIIGFIFKENAKILSPFGDLFLNLLLVIIVPLIFLTLATSIGKMKSPKRIGKILISTFLIFIITSLISVFIGIITTKSFKLINISDESKIKEIITTNEIAEHEKVNYLERTINTISVNDYSSLLTRDNMIALICMSILIGLSINLSKEKGKKILNVLESANSVIQKYIEIIMYYAPFGLGCYFASLVGTFGKELVFGYTKAFIIYTIISIIFYFVIYSLYAIISSGKNGFISYWKNIFSPTVTALATCSSAASIPANIECSRKIGVSEDIANSVIPLGTNFHKDGSIIGSVFKIMFLVNLFNLNIPTSKLLLVSLISTLLITAVPIGGGTISEAFILSAFNFPASCIGMLTIIATIIDPPATVLNVVGDSASSMMISRIVDGKYFLNQKKN